MKGNKYLSLLVLLILFIFSLIATIQRARSDLLANRIVNAMPIPENIPKESVRKPIATIEDIGQPMTACFMTQMNTDPTGW